jgi:phytoene desaturase
MDIHHSNNQALPVSITRAASKQTYYTIRFLVDKDLKSDAYRAYAYFRWLDDWIDGDAPDRSERLATVDRQQNLIDDCYAGRWPEAATEEEAMLITLIRNDRGEDGGLQSYIRNMMAVMAFDAERRGRLVSQEELSNYTHSLAIAVTDALHYFIGHGLATPCSENRHLAASAAHITHMLRDTLEDAAAGYFNIPSELVGPDWVGVENVGSASYQAWVRSRVGLAREYFEASREYVCGVESLRCRLAVQAYMARFEGVLDRIERDGYRLRQTYPRRAAPTAGLSIIWSGLLHAPVPRKNRISAHPVPGGRSSRCESEMKKTGSAIVIGAGIGGIAAAVHLARRGFQVTVVEKNSAPGGRCGRFEHQGHRFDTGPTLFIMPRVYEAEFSRLGAPLSGLLDLERVDPSYHLVFDDGSQLALTSDLGLMEEQLESIQPGAFSGYRRYLAEGRTHYDLAMERLVDRNFTRASEFFTPGNIKLVFKLKLLVNHYQNMSAYFDEPRLKAAFTFQDVYMGLSPFEAPAVFSMMPYSEQVHGVWYPRGGMYSLVEALMEVARQAGVEFLFDEAVGQIEVDDDHARGVILLDGSRLSAEVVVANADLPYVYRDLLPDEGRAERLAHKRFSCSVISFFWGVDKQYKQLHAHTLFLADDYQANFESIVDDLALPENPSLYVHAPARLDPTMAPPGQDTLVAIVPVGHLSENGGQDWQELRDRARGQVFRRLKNLGITDLQDHLKFEVNYTPLSWRKRYNLLKGSTHGLSHTLTQLGYLRPHNRHPRYKNLYFVGASTHPGTGAPTALISARLATERLFEET